MLLLYKKILIGYNFVCIISLFNLYFELYVYLNNVGVRLTCIAILIVFSLFDVFWETRKEEDLIAFQHRYGLLRSAVALFISFRLRFQTLRDGNRLKKEIGSDQKS